jgi:hypothetical protein
VNGGEEPGAERSRLRWALALAGAASIAVVLVVTSAGSTAAAPAAHQPIPSLSLTPSSTPAGENGVACGTATDSQGDIYVADSDRSTIDIFGPDGKRLGSIDNGNHACGLAVDTKGAVYASQAADGNVVKYAPESYPFEGAPRYGTAATIDAGGKARGISLDPYDNRLFVAEGDRVKVYKSNGTLGQDEVQRVLVEDFDSGTFTLTFKGAETKPLAYNASHAEVEAALAELPTIGRGNVSVREGTNGPQDHFITFTGSLGESDVPALETDFSKLTSKSRSNKVRYSERLIRGFNGEIGLGALHDATGVGAYTYDGAETGVRGLLAEAAMNRPARTSSEEPERRLVDFAPSPALGSAGETSVLVNHLPMVYRGYDNYVFVADSSDDGDRIVVFAGNDLRELHRIATIDGSETPAGSIGFDRGGATVGVDAGSGHFYVHDADHSVVDEFEASGPYVGQIGDIDSEGAETTGIAIDRSKGPNAGNVYVSDGSSGALAFGPLQARRREALPNLTFKFKEACGTTVDSYGDVYISNKSGIEVYSPAGEEITKIAVPRACDMATDSAGNLYAITLGGGSKPQEKVKLYEPDSYPPTSTTDFGTPKTILPYEGPRRWLAVDPTNDHLFVQIKEDTLDEFGSAAEGSPQLSDDFGEVLKFTETFNGGLEVCGKTGEIFAAGRGLEEGWRVYVLNHSGTKLLTAIDGSGSPEGRFDEHGSNIAVDQSNCHVFVALAGRPVEEYEASGTYVGEAGPELLFLNGDVAVDNGNSSPNRGNLYVATLEGLFGFGPLGFEPQATTSSTSAIGPAPSLAALQTN